MSLKRMQSVSYMRALGHKMHPWYGSPILKPQSQSIKKANTNCINVMSGYRFNCDLSFMMWFIILLFIWLNNNTTVNHTYYVTIYFEEINLSEENIKF